jgi:methylated-DNA-protein-cysteine methyltransferase-like protein
VTIIIEYVDKIKCNCGQIARLIGRDKNARLVGKVLSQAEFYGSYPYHRVVNHAGRVAPGWQEQRFLLLEEGVSFKEANHIGYGFTLLVTQA